MKKRYDVFIKSCSTKEIVKTIGTNLNESQAERRELTGLSRINDDYYIDVVESEV